MTEPRPRPSAPQAAARSREARSACRLQTDEPKKILQRVKDAE